MRTDWTNKNTFRLRILRVKILELLTFCVSVMLFSANFRFSFEANFSRTLKSEYFSWDLIFSFWSRLQKFSNFEKIFSSVLQLRVKSADFKSFSFSFYFYGSLVYHLRRLFPVKLSGNSLSLRFWAFFVKLSFFFSNSGLVWVREG